MNQNGSLYVQYKALREALSKYFAEYGGWRETLCSPLLHVAIAISVISGSAWFNTHWTDLALSIVPNLLGFSLGTYGILFSLMSGRMKRALRALNNRRGRPYLYEINATFFHFIFVQTLTVLFAITCRQTTIIDLFEAFEIDERLYYIFDIFSFIINIIGFTLMVYSILLAVASSLAIFRLARIVDPSVEE